MKLNRRQFIQSITAATAAAIAYDPEKLLWIPGQKTIFIPPARELMWASRIVSQDELKATMELIKNLPISDKFLYETLVTHDLVQIYYGYTK